MGPYVQLVSANVGTNKPIAADGTIELYFDRELHPDTVYRQSFLLRTANGDLAATPVATYDPVARKVTLSNPDAATKPSWLDPDQSYKVEMPIPEPGSFLGVRAIDGQTLDPASNRIIGFRVCKGTAQDPCPAPAFKPAAVDFCNDVQPIFQNHCAAGQCHGAPPNGSAKLPAAGLILDTSLGFANTALGRISQGSNTGALANRPIVAGRLFGVNMPVVDPGHPENSWIIYKMLLAVPPAKSNASLRLVCDTTQKPPAPTPMFGPTGAPFSPMSDDERARLAEFILGREMPYPSNPGDPLGAPTDNPAMTLEELERISSWIASGANVVECGPCAK